MSMHGAAGGGIEGLAGGGQSGQPLGSTLQSALYSLPHLERGRGQHSHRGHRLCHFLVSHMTLGVLPEPFTLRDPYP